MHPPTVTPGAPRLPRPAPVPELAAKVAPAAAKSFNHVAGTVKGTSVTYADLNACAWYAGGGWELRNRRGRVGRRGLCGSEDSDERKH